MNGGGFYSRTGAGWKNSSLGLKKLGIFWGWLFPLNIHVCVSTYVCICSKYYTELCALYLCKPTFYHFYVITRVKSPLFAAKCYNKSFPISLHSPTCKCLLVFFFHFQRRIRIFITLFLALHFTADIFDSKNVIELRHVRARIEHRKIRFRCNSC